MAKQLHRSFRDQQVRSLLQSYIDKEVELGYILDILKIGRSRFFALLKDYRQNPSQFSIVYKRQQKTRSISPEIEKNILHQLRWEKRLIENADIPIHSYNYSYIRDLLWQKHQQKVSVPTIIKRAKENDFFLRRPKRKAHDREVLTNYIGELIQHDSSHHKWSPYAASKWYLITSLDDYSRKLLYAELVEKETSWDHISALESVVLGYGAPYAYYTDCHSIFRFVQGRDSFWRKHYLVTDDVDPQWKRILRDCHIEPRYALSPQAKGKVERPYGWLQDRLVRTCARENIKTIIEARQILRAEVDRYNNHQVHSTTGEIPSLRFQRAQEEKMSLFRQFMVPPPFKSTKDVFCLMTERVVNPYRKIAFHNLEFKLSGVSVRDTIQLRIVPDKDKGIAEIRFWRENVFLGIQKTRLEDINLVHF
jgi:hypothetical protein